MFLGLEEEPHLPDGHILSLLLNSHCLQVECAKTAVIGVIWSPRGCEKYGKHQNRFSTPRWGICEAGFVIHCLLLLLSVRSMLSIRVAK